MLHPSYTDLMDAVNEVAVENNEHPVVQSRYSIVLATAKRARQIVSGAKPYVDSVKSNKPLSVAVDELYNRKVMIVSDENEDETV
ncbi:MAG: DNA-directed RNA polymerase subunit omega [Lachnospiraceae bacterium]|nr:DNA-directed RNA polymerase subunit omega [Lachnospiraceae bacterium]